MNKLFVWLTGLLAPLWKWLGADPRALQLILDAKLKIGDRTANFMGRQQQKAGNYSWLIYLVMALFGFFIILVYFALDDKPTAIGVVFTVVSVYLGFMLVSEMSENMFDMRDLSILLSRPVSDTTFSLARALHVTVFAAKFALLMLLPLGIALIFFEGPLHALLYGILSVMAVSITISLTLGLYLTLLKRVPTERFRQILGYFQIVLSMLFFVAYQIPNLFNMMDIELEQFQLVGTPWGFSWPGLWLGGIWDVATNGAGNILSLTQAVLAVAITVLGVRYYLSQSEGYGENLMALQLAGSAGAENDEKVQADVRQGRFRQRFAEWFTRPGLERASFNFTWAVMLRDIKFKQQVYPGLILLPIVAIGYLGHGLYTGTLWGEGPQGWLVIAVLYFFALLVVTPLVGVRVSDDFRAAWVFRTNPLVETGALFYGQLLAVICQFLLPVGLIVYVCLLLATGFRSLPDILLSMPVVLIASVLFQMTERTLPFSEDKTAGSFNALGPMILISVVSSLVGFMHWGLRFIPFAIPVAAVLAWALCLLMFRWLRRSRGKVSN